jgi:hypothetical protein
VKLLNIVVIEAETKSMRSEGENKYTLLFNTHIYARLIFYCIKLFIDVVESET